jgi:integrase/recombinase XerD
MKINDERLYKTIKNFLTVYLTNQRGYSHNTVKSYREVINLLLKYMQNTKKLSLPQISFEHFTSQNISEFLEWLQEKRSCSVSTRNQRLIAIRSFVSHAVTLDPALMDTQVEINKVPMKKEAVSVVKFLSEDSVKVLLEQPDISKSNGFRDRFLMILMYDTAARCQEIVDLRIGSIELHDKGSIAYITGKGGKTRTVPLMEKTIQHYKVYLEHFHPADMRNRDDYLFYTTIKGVKMRMSGDNVWAFIKRYGVSAKKLCGDIPDRVHPHQLRHSRAIHLYRRGMPIPLLAEFLGHADISTTQIYAYADVEMKRIAIRKANKTTADDESDVKPVWVNDEDMIRKLYGLMT